MLWAGPSSSRLTLLGRAGGSEGGLERLLSERNGQSLGAALALGSWVLTGTENSCGDRKRMCLVVTAEGLQGKPLWGGTEEDWRGPLGEKEPYFTSGQ